MAHRNPQTGEMVKSLILVYIVCRVASMTVTVFSLSLSLLPPPPPPYLFSSLFVTSRDTSVEPASTSLSLRPTSWQDFVSNSHLFSTRSISFITK